MKDLSRVTARQLMRSPVIVLPEDATIEEAIGTFEDENVSGIPIVDDAGHAVGLLSEHDVARAEHLRKDRIQTGREWSFGATADAVTETMEEQESSILAREDYSPDMLARDTVRDWMTPRLVTAPPSTPIWDLCEVMRRESIHRVLIVQQRRLVGIVTSSDIVRWLAENLPAAAPARAGKPAQPAQPDRTSPTSRTSSASRKSSRHAMRSGAKPVKPVSARR
jgi:CBS domain-containing protein